MNATESMIYYLEISVMDKKQKENVNKRKCRHHHGNEQNHVEEPEASGKVLASPVVETKKNQTVDIQVIDHLTTEPSVRAQKSLSSYSRRLDNRPLSTRSTFEHVLGTRPASRRKTSTRCGKHSSTISRNSTRSRKSRLDTSGSQAFKGQGSDTESDDERKVANFEADFNTLDIHDEKAFDTDLEVEGVNKNPHIVDGVLDFQSLRLAYCEQAARMKQKGQTEANQSSSYDHTGKTSYIDTCKKLGVVPASFFLRHMHDPHLNMRHHGLGPAGMRALAESLSTNSQVLQLDLSDNSLGPHGGIAVCEMLKENCFITELNLSENHLGTECAPALANIMQQNSTLTHITLAGNDFDDHSAPYFAEAILSTTKVQVLDLSHNNFGDVSGTILGPAIADNTCIKELDLSWNCLRRKGAVAIAQGIKNNVYMKKINLSWNGFGLEGAVGLQDALKGNSVLEELDISNNRITTEGAVVIGKGLSANETLLVLKMGKNPMQSAGCYGICAAILRNPNCVLKVVDFCDILVNKDFEEVFAQVKVQLPSLTLTHGGMEPPTKPKAKVHPMTKLVNYIEKHELRLVDFFNKFDKDGSMSVTHEEFVEGIEETGIKLTAEEIEILLDVLDRDGDGEINYNELVVSHVDFQEKREQINTVLTVMQPRPMTT
ncbi:leucine-rich repeat-containing protein 74A-like isoform X2 [Dreissena polymorpha]|uniref:leucine-rich repeat-containing protein 74A-like isoform X2 n=1 Tax=Dreissena polymorpha TaxID=45954 RepID=UPI0022656BB3|nr:leucine-rich repeat-containing protein 74A-like isoform X2 [Dreissena polymorpha]